MKKLILPLVIILSLSACKEKINNIQVEVASLSASCVYNEDSVFAFLNGSELNKKIAEGYEERSKQLEEEDLSRSIYLQKRSVALYPKYEGYQRLGTLLKRDKKYNEASQVYGLLVGKIYTRSGEAGHWNFVFKTPDFDDYYNHFASRLRAFGAEPGIIYFAREDSLDLQKIRERLLDDTEFGFDKNSESFKNLLVNFWTEEEVEAYKKSGEAFTNFLRSAKDTSRDFSIKEPEVANFQYMITYDGPQEIGYSDFNQYFLEERQKNKEFYADFNIKRSFAITDDTYAVVYALDSSMNGCSKELRNITHRLVIYNSKGEAIDSKTIARQGPHDMILAEVKYPAMKLSYYKRYWKLPYEQGQMENELSKIEFEKEEVYLIENNKIIESDGMF
jgi:hypothetical protein